MQILRIALVIASLHPVLSQSAALEHETQVNSRNAEPIPDSYPLDTHDLEKRRGGGGGRGGGSGGGSGGGGTRPSGNGGGTFPGGSGVRPAYGGRYAGGATVPYASGARGPSGIVPGFLIGGALGFWLIYSWGPYGAYNYPYPANITYFNQTSNMNETVPGTCLCSRYLSCSCTGEVDGQYVQALVGDGSYRYQQDNAQVFQLTTVNGTRTLAVNGTLDNGTAADDGTATTDDSSDDAASRFGGALQHVVWLALGSMAVTAFATL